MANFWYNRVKTFLAGTKARGSDVRSEFDLVVSAFDDMPAPHSGVPTTKGFADAIELESTLQVDGTTNLAGGLGANVDGASTYKLTNMIDGTDTQDYATVAQVAAGGSPGDIPITSLGVGTATASQYIQINSGGAAVIGVDAPAEFIYPLGYFSGLELNSYDLSDRRRDMRLDVGSCLDSDGDELLTLGSSIEKQMDVAWVEGAGGGAGAVLPSSAGTGTYYFFLITKDTDGTVDWMGDTSSTGANVPSGWTVRRQLGSWPYLNVGGGSMGWVDGAGRRQFGNRVMSGVTHRSAPLVADSSLSATAESFNLSSVINSSEKSVAKLEFTAFSTNTGLSFAISYGYHTSPSSGVASSLQAGITATGDSNYNSVIEDLYNENTTFYYRTTGAAANTTFYVGILEYDNMREVNY